MNRQKRISGIKRITGRRIKQKWREDEERRKRRKRRSQKVNKSKDKMKEEKKKVAEN